MQVGDLCGHEQSCQASLSAKLAFRLVLDSEILKPGATARKHRPSQHEGTTQAFAATHGKGMALLD